MSDRRTHRGPHPEDARLFAPDALPILRQAVAELSWLLSRRYATGSALTLVGDHHQLDARQRLAVMRSACADQGLAFRRATELPPAALAGATLYIDGYNLLTSIEAALSGGFILIGRDGCCRDMSSMHGSYRKVSETVPALELIGRGVSDLAVTACRWYLDSPVSNSGRLKTIMYEVAARAGWNWQVDVVLSPDHELMALAPPPLPEGEGRGEGANRGKGSRDRGASAAVIITADSAILDAGVPWSNLARHLITTHIPTARLIDLGVADPPSA